jgi:hypothetical protein
VNIRRNFERLTGAIQRFTDRFRKQQDTKSPSPLRRNASPILTHGHGRGNGVKHVHVKRAPKRFGVNKGRAA